jgi:hypothetical protein
MKIGSYPENPSACREAKSFKICSFFACTKSTGMGGALEMKARPIMCLITRSNYEGTSSLPQPLERFCHELGASWQDLEPLFQSLLGQGHSLTVWKNSTAIGNVCCVGNFLLFLAELPSDAKGSQFRFLRRLPSFGSGSASGSELNRFRFAPQHLQVLRAMPISALALCPNCDIIEGTRLDSD